MKTLIVLSVLALAVHAEIDCTNLADGIFGWGCRSYTQCNGGVGTQVDCPAPLVFNYLTNGCDETKNTPPPCGIYRDCSQKADGRYADTLLKCTSFYTCIKGKYFGHNPCIPGTVFNEKSQNCDWPRNVEPPCGTLKVEGTTEIPGTTAAPVEGTTEIPETTAAPSAGPTVAPDNGNCDNRDDGRYADKSLGCKAFYICLGGKNIALKPCAPGTVFNEEIQVCDWPRNVKPPCGTLVVESTTEEAQTTTTTTEDAKTTKVVATTTEETKTTKVVATTTEKAQTTKGVATTTEEAYTTKVVATTTEENIATTESEVAITEESPITEDYDLSIEESDTESSEEAQVNLLYQRIIQASRRKL